MSLGSKVAMVLAAAGSMFDDGRRLRPDRGTRPRFAKPKHRKNRLARKKAFAAAQSDRHLEVSCCHKCRKWFPTFEKRNEHRAEKHAPVQIAVLGKVA